jgi:hypothetical protein
METWMSKGVWEKVSISAGVEHRKQSASIVLQYGLLTTVWNDLKLKDFRPSKIHLVMSLHLFLFLKVVFSPPLFTSSER